MVEVEELHKLVNFNKQMIIQNDSLGRGKMQQKRFYLRVDTHKSVF